MVDVDYVTKWVEAIPTSSVDHNTSIKLLKEVIFPRFGVPRYLMTDGGSHFIHGAFRKMLAKYDVNHRDLERISLRNLMMHYWPIELHIKILWVCLRIKWFMEKLVICLLS